MSRCATRVSGGTALKAGAACVPRRTTVSGVLAPCLLLSAIVCSLFLLTACLPEAPDFSVFDQKRVAPAIVVGDAKPSSFEVQQFEQGSVVSFSYDVPFESRDCERAADGRLACSEVVAFLYTSFDGAQGTMVGAKQVAASAELTTRSANGLVSLAGLAVGCHQLTLVVTNNDQRVDNVSSDLRPGAAYDVISWTVNMRDPNAPADGQDARCRLSPTGGP